MMRKCYSVSRIPIYENNDTVRKSLIAYRHGIIAKFTSAAVFTAAEDSAYIETRRLGAAVWVIRHLIYG